MNNRFTNARSSTQRRSARTATDRCTGGVHDPGTAHCSTHRRQGPGSRRAAAVGTTQNRGDLHESRPYPTAHRPQCDGAGPLCERR